MSSLSSKGTKLQQVTNALAELETQINDLVQDESALASKTDATTCAKILDKLDSTGAELQKLVSKASEKDPNKRVYNKTVTEKVLPQTSFHFIDYSCFWNEACIKMSWSILSWSPSPCQQGFVPNQK